jgi:type IV pilus assembly protein PilA
MLARIRKSIEEKEEGFTLIELLVVMIIIGILAAIAIPVFLSQRQKGYDASVKSDLRTMANELESYQTDYQSYPPTGTTFAATSGTAGSWNIYTGDAIRISTGNSFAYFTNTAGTAYCVQGVNTKGTHAWEYISDLGGLQAAGTLSTNALGSACTVPTGAGTF